MKNSRIALVLLALGALLATGFSGPKTAPAAKDCCVPDCACCAGGACCCK